MADPSLLKRLVALPTGNACDALIEMGWLPTAMRGVRPVGSGAPFAGPAFSLRQVPRTTGALSRRCFGANRGTHGRRAWVAPTGFSRACKRENRRRDVVGRMRPGPGPREVLGVWE